jgi:hypothetical protein
VFSIRSGVVGDEVFVGDGVVVGDAVTGPRTDAVNAGPVVRTKQTTDRSDRTEEVIKRANGPSFGRWADAAVQEATDGNK